MSRKVLNITPTPIPLFCTDESKIIESPPQVIALTKETVGYSEDLMRL